MTRAALAGLWKRAGPLSSRTEMSPFLMHVPVGGLSGIHLRLPVGRSQDEGGQQTLLSSQEEI